MLSAEFAQRIAKVNKAIVDTAKALHITKTLLFKYIENFRPKKENFQIKKF